MIAKKAVPSAQMVTSRITDQRNEPSKDAVDKFVRNKAGDKSTRKKYVVKGESAGKKDSLRNITRSGGLFNESALLRLRDKPKAEPMGEWKGFALKPEERLMSFDHELQFTKTWNWAQDAWRQISSGFGDFSISSVYQYWIGELLAQLGHKIMPTRASDEKHYPVLGSLKIEYRQEDYSIPLLYVIQSNSARPFDEVVPADPEQMSYHDRCQLYVNTFPDCPWMILTNGRIIRLVTRYSHVFNKSFLQFDLQNIIEGEDQKEFELLYRFLHKSRYIILRDYNIAQELDRAKAAINRVLVSIPAKLKQKLLDHVLEGVDGAIAGQDKKGKEIQQVEKVILTLLGQDGITLTKNNEAQIKVVFKDVMDVLKDLFPLKAEEKDDYLDVVKEAIGSQIYEVSFEKLDSFLATLKDYLVDVHERISKGLIKEYDESDMQAMLFRWNKDYSIHKDIQDAVSKEVKKVFVDELGKIPLVVSFLETCKQQGQQIGKILSKNVTIALEILGNELIHSNPEFKDGLIEGKIDIDDFYAEILRVVYRIIFILYAEKRQMFPGEGSLFQTYYSFSRYHQKLEKPILDDPDYDNWENFLTILNLLETGNAFFKVNGFGDFFSISENLPLINKYDLKVSNSAFLRVLNRMTTFKHEGIYQPVDYINLAEEEIGGIYEILLENKPSIRNEIFQFDHDMLDRKSSGSYYTAKALIEIMIEQALKPVLNQKLEGAKDKDEKRSRLLSLSVLDPSCGGGSILLAATDYLGKELARIESENENPSDIQLREGRRNVVQNCIYGVDINPLAIELCKISLWLRVAMKDSPLSLLDNHIKCGDSLVGFDFNRLNKDNSFIGKDITLKIQPEWINAFEGKDKTGALPEDVDKTRKIRETIRNELLNKSLFDWVLQDKDLLSKCYVTINSIIKKEERTLLDHIRKKTDYHKFIENPLIKKYRWLCDTICSCFFWRLEKGVIDPPTNYVLNYIINDQREEAKKHLQIIEELRTQYSFFHWFIEFPEVFGKEEAGFDVVLGNPPWDMVQIDEIEFFRSKNEEIVNAKGTDSRNKLIEDLAKKNPTIYQCYRDALIQKRKQVNFFKKSNWYPLSTFSNLATYPLFIERFSKLLAQSGRFGLLCPTTFLVSNNLQDLFQGLTYSNALIAFYDFENKGTFQIDDRFHFIVLIGANPSRNYENRQIVASYMNSSPENVLLQLMQYQSESDKKMKDPSKKLSFINLQSTDFELFNPNTETAAMFNTIRDFEITKAIFEKVPVLIYKKVDSEINPWNITFVQAFHMSHDWKYFHEDFSLKREGLKAISNKGDIYYPLYEGKTINYYDHRYNSSSRGEGYKLKPVSVDAQSHQMIDFEINPAYWVSKDGLKAKWDSLSVEGFFYDWFIGFRNTSARTNWRTFVASIIPFTATGDKLPLILSRRKPKEICCLLANLSSFCFDYLVRQKLGGTSMSFFIVEQIPVFPPSYYSEEMVSFISSRVIKLTFTSWSLHKFGKDCEIDGAPFPWNEQERTQMIAELDALYFLLYNVSIDSVEYIMETFPIVKRTDIERYGYYKTKELILRYYNDLQVSKSLKDVNWVECAKLKKQQIEIVEKIRGENRKTRGRIDQDDNSEETDQ